MSTSAIVVGLAVGRLCMFCSCLTRQRGAIVGKRMVAIEPNSWRTTSFAQDSTAFICYCDVPDDSGSCCHYLAEVDVPNSSSSSRNAFSKEKEVLEGVLGWAIAYGNCDE